MTMKGTVAFAAVALCAALSGSVLANSGGPDTYGYRWQDNQTPEPADINVPGTTTDASWTYYLNNTSWQAWWSPDADDSGFWYDSGFTKRFYGTSYPGGTTNIWVATNGYILLGTNAGGYSYSNVAIPNTNVPNSMIAALYDDLNPNAGGDIDTDGISDMRVGTGGVSPNRWVAVQVQTVPQYAGSDQNSFMIVLFEASGTADSEIHFVYNALGAPNDNVTIGVENQAGTIGLAYINNVQQVPAAGTVIRFYAVGNEPPEYPTHQHVFPRSAPDMTFGTWHGCIAVEPWLTNLGGGDPDNLCREGDTPHHDHGIVQNMEEAVPRFTAVYSDPPGGRQTGYDTANRYWIAVAEVTDPITGAWTLIWDSGSDLMTPVTDVAAQDDWIQPIVYGSGDTSNDWPSTGAPRLTWGKTYLWQICLFDDDGEPSDWSDIGAFSLRSMESHGRAHTGEGGGGGGNCLLDIASQGAPLVTGACAIVVLGGLLALRRSRRR